MKETFRFMGDTNKMKKLTVFAVFVTVLAAIAFADAKKTGRPVNTTQDVPQTGAQEGFSKSEFIKKIQEVLRSKNTQAAIALYDELPESEAQDTDLLIIKASLYISTANLKEAKSVCSAVLEKDSANLDALELLLYIARLQNDSKSESQYEKALLAKDTNLALGENAFENKNYKQARQYFQKALVREATNQDALFGLGQADYYLGAKDASMDTEAEGVFKKILALNPQNSLAYSYLGKLAAAANKYKAASDYVKKAIDIDNDNYNYYIDYGMYQNYLSNYDTAVSAWTQAIQLQPNYFLAYAYRGSLYDEQGQEELAIADYNQVVRCNPDYYYAYESIGVLQIHQKNWSAAREAFMKCYEKDKSANISYPLMVTYCYYMEKDKINAKKFSDKVLRKMDRSSIEYAMLRVFHDESGEMPLPQKINTIDNTKQKGKMWFYLGLFYDMFGGSEFAAENYTKLLAMNSPMIFEYRLAEWRLGKLSLDSEDKSLSKVGN